MTDGQAAGDPVAGGLSCFYSLFGQKRENDHFFCLF